VRDLGEGEYMRRKLRGATAWIREHPVEFASLTFSRGWHVWLGPPDRPHVALPTAVLSLLALLGLRRALPGMDRPTRAAIVIPLAAYPLVTYLVAWIPRYLFPLSGLLLVLAAGEVLALATRKSPMP
jgi:prepilin signal peptidase PulO-like enzyme (type II secretory pathway)